MGHIEEVAKQKKIKYVNIGANLTEKDELVLRILKKWGYKYKSMSKEIY